MRDSVLCVCSVVESGLEEIPTELVLLQRTCQVIVVGCTRCILVVVLEVKTPMESATFSSLLKVSIEQWRIQVLILDFLSLLVIRVCLI